MPGCRAHLGPHGYVNAGVDCTIRFAGFEDKFREDT